VALVAWLLPRAAQWGRLWRHEAAAVVNREAKLPFQVTVRHLEKIEDMLREAPDGCRVAFRKPLPKATAVMKQADDLERRVSRLEAQLAKLLERLADHRDADLFRQTEAET
jgi:hypothetical protein